MTTPPMKKLSCLGIGLLFNLFISAQTNSIEQMNRILQSCNYEVCSRSFQSKEEEEFLICCISKGFIEYNKSKEEIIYTRKCVNRINKMVVQTCVTKIKVCDIDFNNILVTGDGINEEFSVVVFAKEGKMLFVTSCQNADSSGAVSDRNELRFIFGPNCKDGKLPKKFSDLLKKLGATK